VFIKEAILNSKSEYLNKMNVSMHALSTGTNITPLGDTYAVLIVDCFFFSPLVGGRLFM
jgi:hypothetical protein